MSNSRASLESIEISLYFLIMFSFILNSDGEAVVNLGRINLRDSLHAAIRMTFLSAGCKGVKSPEAPAGGTQCAPHWDWPGRIRIRRLPGRQILGRG